MNAERPKRRLWSPWYLLFLALFAVALYPPLYNRVEPTLAGVPFFYWFQLALILAGAIITIVVYFATDE